jgi:DNA-binding NarL/FixJ family response regulator
MLMVASVLIVDDNPRRLALSREWLQNYSYELLDAASEQAALAKAESRNLDLILFRVSLGFELFHKLVAVSQGAGTFVAPFIEPGFSPDLRKKVLELNADGFISEELPRDERIAIVDALFRKKRRIDALKQQLAEARSVAIGSEPKKNVETRPLRERSPELYKDLLCRYEESVKRVLETRIYKIKDNMFEPFRQIAKQLFEAEATARDAVELHYQTLRKIAPTPDTPRAQGYLEVGRTTIVGLMGDLITCYREANRNQDSSGKFKHSESADS